MARYSRKSKSSPETREEAMKIAKATQKPGQTKEQTRLIAQGIRKGIDQYKKKQKEKSRELDKRLKEAQSKPDTTTTSQAEVKIVYRHPWLPWILLAISWLGFALFVSLDIAP